VTSKQSETRANVPRSATRCSDVRQQVRQAPTITAALEHVTKANVLAICSWLAASVKGNDRWGQGDMPNLYYLVY
jgi:hypothetical protein